MEIHRICIVGGGLMGAGIASVCGFHGCQVSLVDLDDNALADARRRVQFGVEKLMKKEESGNILAHIRFSVDLASAVANAQLIIECVPEDLEAKRQLLNRICLHCSRDAIIGTNTSSLRIADIGQHMGMMRGRFAGIHFFNPVPKMPLVELIPSSEMSQALVAKLEAFLKSIGKVPVLCKDTPGFVANRILIPLLTEAMGIVERGVASPEQVDLVCHLGLGLPIGPFRLLDFLGLDTAQNIIAGWAQLYPEEFPNLRQSKVLSQLVANGKMGRKSGQGFYKYSTSKL